QHRTAGRRSGQGKTLGERHDRRSHHHVARGQDRRCPGRDAPLPHFRRAHHQEQATGWHSHQSRSALRDPHRHPHQRSHDQREPHHGSGGHHPERRRGHSASAPHRETSGGGRSLQPVGPHSRKGHPEAPEVS